MNPDKEHVMQALKTAGVARESLIYKTLASNGDKTGPLIAVLPVTEHLNEKKTSSSIRQ